MLGEINIDWTLLYMEYFTLQKVICLVSFLQAEMNKKILTTETLGDLVKQTKKEMHTNLIFI